MRERLDKPPRTSYLLDVTGPGDRKLGICGLFIGGGMRPLRRSGVSKGRSARKFRKHVGRTKARNMSPGPMRGGIRL